MRRCSIAMIVVLISAGGLAAQSRPLTDGRYLNEFPTVERIKAEMKGADEVDSYARFLAAMTVINQFMIDDLVRAPNGGMYNMPPAADKVHDRYLYALTRYEIDSPEPQAKDPRFGPLRDKYENAAAFADALLQRFFTADFRSGYYEWTRKRMPDVSIPNPYLARTVAASPTNGGKITPPRSSKPLPCARVAVSSPLGAADGEPITFTADVTGVPEDETVTFNWTMTAGTISSGQGTSSITVDTSGQGGYSVTATVYIGGERRECGDITAKGTTVIRRSAPATRKIDEFGAIQRADMLPRLDNLAIELQNDPRTSVYILVYGGPRSLKSTTAKLLSDVKNYLVGTRAIEARRIFTVDGGRREELAVELWVVPSGAAPPQASSTVGPSVVKPPAKKKPPVSKVLRSGSRTS